MQIDFGLKKVWLGTVLVTVHLLVATLSYSRRVFSYSQRVFVKAFLGERTVEWLNGIALRVPSLRRDHAGASVRPRSLPRREH